MKDIACVIGLTLFIISCLLMLGLLGYALYLLLAPEFIVFGSALFSLFCAAAMGSDR